MFTTKSYQLIHWDNHPHITKKKPILELNFLPPPKKKSGVSTVGDKKMSILQKPDDKSLTTPNKQEMRERLPGWLYDSFSALDDQVTSTPDLDLRGSNCSKEVDR